MLRDRNDTIAAIATPLGEAGIAVIRISGSEALEIAGRAFAGKSPLDRAASHTVHHGKIATSAGETIDEVLVSVFRKPHSYTGEDTAEISCHGSYYVATKILESVIADGARLADPGEFTLRAFLNGKMDLMQAEAVADLIHSKTALAHRASLEQLRGVLSNAILDIRQKLIDLCSLLELELDFAEEGIELTNRSRVDTIFGEAITDVEQLIGSYNYGRIIRDGVKVVLAGAPNTGKSSLLNVLLRDNRAIVSDIPGTTRDVIEESILLNGIAFRLVDTAGLRDGADVIEQEGVRRSRQQMSDADLILLLLDSSKPFSQSEHDMVTDLVGRFATKLLLVLNKLDIRSIDFPMNSLDSCEKVSVSCKSGEGINLLTSKMFQCVVSNCDLGASSTRIQSERHRDLLKKTKESLLTARSTFRDKMSGEFVTVDLHAALNFLGEIIGLTTPDDVLNNIFSRFCVGK